MGQLRTVAEVYEEYTARAVEAALKERGIHCVVFNNEIPMEPGFNFGMRPWGQVVVAEEDCEQAREFAQDVLAAIHGEEAPDHSELPVRLKVRSRQWLGVLFVFMLLATVVSTLLNYTFGEMIMRDAFIDHLQGVPGGWTGSLMINLAIAGFLALFILMVLALAAYNWSRLGRALVNALVGLAATVVLLTWGIYAALAAVARGIVWLVKGDKPQATS
ncbi:DUF2007 domain-containing protein [bacterium]|nr:DUF2007 domain-containing protein [bacterium]